jgi:hypothetical protein
MFEKGGGVRAGSVGDVMSRMLQNTIGMGAFGRLGKIIWADNFMKVRYGQS